MTSPIAIRDDDFDAFWRLPRDVYGADSPYVAPLRSDLRRALEPAKNPLWQASSAQPARRVMTAHRDGRAVARLVVHVHEASNARHDWRRAWFGYFDAADDLDAARALFDEADAFASARGCTSLAGNFNLTAMQQMGIVTEGFEHAPYSDMVWNPPHVPRLLERLGFTATFPATTFELALDATEPARLLTTPARARLVDPALEWRTLHPSRMREILSEVRAVLNDGFADNPFFVPLTADEMHFQAADLSHVLDPAITALVHDADGPAGVVLCIPDLNPLFRAIGSRYGLTTPWHFLQHRRRRDRAVIVFYSVARRRHGQGLMPAMLARVVESLKAGGYRRLGITWIADVNRASLRQMERLGAVPLHRTHVFERAVS